MKVLRTFLDYIRHQQLFTEDDKILLAVSGGKDSVLMTQLFAQSKYSFGIAHCNFQLRGDESEKDAVFVEKLAKELNVPFFKINFDTKEFATKEKISIQMSARDLRYDWLEKIRVAENYSFVAVAHHQTDSVETVLLNLVRGTGIAGLHGILPKRDHIVRPLLALTGEEVTQMIEEQGIAFREDESNKESKYARNRVRLEVLPAFKEINPTLEKTFSIASQRFLALEMFLNQQVATIRVKLFLEKEKGVFFVDISTLKAEGLDSFILYEIFRPFGFSEPILKDLLENLEQPESGKIFYSETHQLLINRHELIVREIQDKVEQAVFIPELPTVFSWYGKSYSLILKDLAIDKVDFRKTMTVVLDADKVIFPLEVRVWRAGDFFKPLGLNGTKKISDFLINQKIALDEKNRIPLLINSNQDILSVCVLRIDDRYKITAETKKVIIFEQI